MLTVELSSVEPVELLVSMELGVFVELHSGVGVVLGAGEDSGGEGPGITFGCIREGSGVSLAVLFETELLVVAIRSDLSGIVSGTGRVVVV